MTLTLPACRWNHSDCFVIDEAGRCRLLSNTEFSRKDCPFYKPKDESSKIKEVK